MYDAAKSKKKKRQKIDGIEKKCLIRGSIRTRTYQHGVYIENSKLQIQSHRN
jgi:hypothetical protein